MHSLRELWEKEEKIATLGVIGSERKETTMTEIKEQTRELQKR
ncbi:Uncharacterised protein [Chlamydia trachomatis]|nr:Uncharacterised protein [Chlamydia trachomatis]